MIQYNVLPPHICGVIDQQIHHQDLRIKVCLTWEKYLLRLIGFFGDQFRIPLGVQLADATASRGLAPKPPKSGWYPQCLLLWIDSVSVGKDTQLYEYFSLCYDDPAPGQGSPREGECGLPSLPYGVSNRTRDWHFATGLVRITKTQCL